MCGAFNSNIVRRALDRVHEYQAQGIETDLIVAGRKGIGTLRFQGYKPLATYMDITDRSAFLDAQAMPTGRRPVCDGEGGPRPLGLQRFKSAMEQFITDQVILPSRRTGAEYTPQALCHMDFLYEPSPRRSWQTLSHLSGDNDLSACSKAWRASTGRG